MSNTNAAVDAPHRSWAESPFVRLCVRGARWLGAATMAWFVVLVLAHDLEVDAFASTSLANVALAFELSLALSIPLVSAHALHHVLVRRVSTRAAIVVVSLVVLTIAAFPAWSIAQWLTSGDLIAAHPLRAPLRAVSFVVGTAMWPVLWLWHIASSGTVAMPARWTKRRQRRTEALMMALGLMGLLAIVLTSARKLDAYAFLAQFSVPAGWLLAATILDRACKRARRLPLAMFVIGLLTRTSVYEQMLTEDARERWHTHHRLAALSDDLITSAAGDSVFAFDLEHSEDFHCDAVRVPALGLGKATPIAGVNHVILISIDALRPDAVDGVANGRPIAPNLRRLRDSSIAFRRAVTTYPATVFALGGAFTGYGPSELLMQPAFPRSLFGLTKDRFPRQIVVLPDSPWFRAPVIDALITQGVEVAHHDDARAQQEAFMSQLEAARRAGERTLAWLHLFEPHEPYRSHPAFEFGDDPKSRYASEIAYVDDQLGRLFAALEQGGWFRDSLVVVFSDHGEALGDRGYFGHHVYLNAWMTDIVLWARWPESTAATSDALVDIRDVFATVMHVAGLPIDGSSAARSLIVSAGDRGKAMVVSEAFPVRGEDLFALSAQPVRTKDELSARIELVRRPVPNYQPKVAITTQEYRFIMHRNGVRELYARDEDPEEERNLAYVRPAIVREFEAMLTRWHEQTSEAMYCRLVAVATPARTRAR